MKKMFITGMNKTKTYIEPEMKVIEVDVESLCQDSGDDGYDIGAGDIPVVDEVKEEKSWLQNEGNSLWGNLW